MEHLFYIISEKYYIMEQNKGRPSVSEHRAWPSPASVSLVPWAAPMVHAGPVGESRAYRHEGEQLGTAYWWGFG